MPYERLPFHWPGAISTTLFMLVVIAVCVTLVLFVYRAYNESERTIARRRSIQTALAILVIALITGALAQSGLLLRLAGTPGVLVYPIAFNAIALGVALSSVGRRLSALPLAWLVLLHTFRLPLELILHAWFEQGSIPLQMTYRGQNFDIITGVASLFVGIAALVRTRSTRMLVWTFNVTGTLLLLNVIRIAITSVPGPLRSLGANAPLLLPFYLPFTWILPFCVAPALLGHLVLFRALLSTNHGSE